MVGRVLNAEKETPVCFPEMEPFRPGNIKRDDKRGSKLFSV